MINEKQINKYIKSVDDLVYAKNPTNAGTKVVVHHSAIPQSVKNQATKILRAHVDENKWAGGGYNILILPDGTIYQYRAIGIDLAAHKGYNDKYLAVCFVGNFENEFVTQSQKNSYKKVIGWLSKKQGIDYSKKFTFHRKLSNTKCCGKNITEETIHKIFDKKFINTNTKQMVQKLLDLIQKLENLLAVLKKRD